LRQQNASAKSAEMAGFYKSLELLNQGDVAGATEVARQTGHTLPPQVVQNAELRNFVTSIAKRAQELYKDRADLQQQFIQSKMEAHAAQVQPGGQPQPGQPQPNQPQQPAQQSNPITDPYTMPPGAPAIPETSGVHNFEVVNRQETDAEGKPVVKSYRFDKRSGQMTPIEGDGVVLPRNSAGGAGAGGGLTPEAINGAAERVLNGDPKALQNIGRGAQGAAALTAINNRVYELAKERGVSAQQIGTQVAAFAGQQAAMRTLGTKGANIEYAANTASRAIDFAQEAMSKVPRSQFLPFGKLQQIIDTQTNSPEQAAAFTATNTLVNEYARVVSPTGQPTEGTRQHAREMLNTAQSHDAFNATLAMMRREIASAKAAFDQTRQEFLARGGPSPTPALTGSPDHSSLSDDDLKLKLGL
jgi:hypothetical protein